MKSRSMLIVVAAKISLFSLIVLCTFAPAAGAQSFSSGSNGSDGALDLTGTAAGTTVTFVPANFPGNQHNLGIYNFTDITIPAGVTVRLSALHLNGPVYWLASGNVDIEGTVDLSGQPGYPASLTVGGRLRPVDAGAGGYPGGMSANTTVSTISSPGDGPGGGAGGTLGIIYAGTRGTYSGNSFLVPLVGGSGGGGGLGFGDPLLFGGSGGAGGGAILIASSTSITVNGTIDASGGAGGSGAGTYGGEAYGGPGSGGGIHLVTNTIAGNGSLYAAVVRIEAFNSSSAFSIQGSESSDTPTTPLILPTQPQPSVSVASVNSVAVPATPSASISSPDVTIDSTSAVTITIKAANIPVGTVVTLHLYSDNTSTDQTVQTTPLAGTFASSTATASVTFPSGYSMNYVKATWTGTY